MANMCYIKTKMKRDEVCDFIKSQLETLNLKPTFHFYPEEKSYIEVKINGVDFPLFLERGRIEMYDCPDTALSRSERTDYSEVGFVNSRFYFGFTCAYSFIYEFIKHSLAEKNGVKIDSDGADKMTPFGQGKKMFSSFEAWLNHYEEKEKQEKFRVSKLFGVSIAKIKKTEKQFFPELFT